VIANGVTLTSDRRWKKNIAPIKNSIEKLKQIQGVTYVWAKDEFPEKYFNDRRQIGVIAQDVLKVFPELVSQDKDGFYTVNYPALIAPVIEAIKEQQQQMEVNVRMFKTMQGEIEEIKSMALESKRDIASLKEENALLKKKNKKIEQEVNELKQRLERLEKLIK